MTKRTAKFTVFEGADRQWYWRLSSANGQIVAQSEGYRRQSGATAGVRAAKRLTITATIVKAPSSP